ncbi:MAG: polyketide antibiotic transporter [Solirubrobacteraceae bacterium]
MQPASAVARRAFADARTRTISFALLFAVGSSATVLGYRAAYPDRADRLEFARSFGGNRAVRLLYGTPHDLLTVGGYAGWRLVGSLSIFAALWGVLAAVRALRAEEEAGRQELILAGVVGRRAAFAAALAAIAGGAVVLWLALWLGILTGGAGAGPSAYLALAILSPLPVFAGVGALASQLAPTRRGALALGTGVLGLALLVRMVADTASGAGRLRWVTPLGWAEELRAFAGARPLVLLLPVASAALMLALAARLSERRDVGVGLLAAHDGAAPRLALLSSPAGLAVRTLRGGFLAWLAGIGVYALIMGGVSGSVASGLSASLQKQLEKLGAAGPATPRGFLGFAFLFFVLAISLFGTFQLSAIREEEAEQRLETLFAQPVGRARWLAERLGLAAAGAACLALAAGLFAWAGAGVAGAHVALGRMLEAGANCLPACVLFLGLGALAVALAPRAGVLVAYALVSAAFLWETVGGLLGAPAWLLGVSPFHHVALVPAEPLKATGAAVLLALGLVAAGLAAGAFRQRDLTGA